MGRAIVVRAVTAGGQSVLAQQQVVTAQDCDTLQDIFYKLDVSDRYADGCVVFPNARAQPGEGTGLSNLSLTLQEIDNQCLALGIPQPQCFRFTVSGLHESSL